MKIAICFSGQPRFVEECYAGIKKNIIEANSLHSIDVFVHTWFSESMVNKKLYHEEFSSFSGEAKIKDGSVERIKELYCPISMVVDEPMNFNSSLNYDGSFNKQIESFRRTGMEKSDYIKLRLDSTFSCFYSIMRSNMEKKIYELKNGITYDWVVRLRFDNIIKSPIKFEDLSPILLYHQEMNKPENEISDWINFSNSKNMDSYSSVFHTLEKLAESCTHKYGWFSPESLLKEVCIRDQIETFPLHLNTELPRWGKI